MEEEKKIVERRLLVKEMGTMDKHKAKRYRQEEHRPVPPVTKISTLIIAGIPPHVKKAVCEEEDK